MTSIAELSELNRTPEKAPEQRIRKGWLVVLGCSLWSIPGAVGMYEGIRWYGPERATAIVVARGVAPTVTYRFTPPGHASVEGEAQVNDWSTITPGRSTVEVEYRSSDPTESRALKTSSRIGRGQLRGAPAFVVGLGWVGLMAYFISEGIQLIRG